MPLHGVVGGQCTCRDASCRSPGKHPLTLNGVKDATLEPRVVKYWAEIYPESNIGIAMRGDLMCVDVDPRNGGDANLETIVSQFGPLPNTWAAKTGGGGNHFVFRNPDRRRIPGQLRKGIDLKGEGGYIVVEPSVHASGGSYNWDAGSDPREGAELADMPEWIGTSRDLEASTAKEGAASIGARVISVGIIPPQQLVELKSALAYIPAEDYVVWRDVGMALHSTSAPNARGIWDEWSQKSDKYFPKGQSKAWNGFTHKPNGLHIESIFAMAALHGWVNPASKAAQLADQENGWRLRPMSEVLLQPSKTSWLVRGILDVLGVSCLFGASGTGKSFLAVDLAACIATGTAWHGRRVSQGPVIYLAGEGHRGIAKRFLAWQTASGVELSTTQIHVSNAPISLSNTRDVVRVVAAVTALAEKPSLIIVDTLHRHFGAGADENSTSDMGAFLMCVDELRRDLSSALLIVHHTGHAAADRERGNSALRGAMDWSYSVQKSSSGPLTLQCRKAKDYEPPDPLQFDLTTVDLEWLDEDGEKEQSAVLKLKDAGTPARLGANQLLAMTALKRLCNGRTDKDLAVLESEWRESSGLARNRWAETKSRLVDIGRVRIVGDAVELLPDEK